MHPSVPAIPQKPEVKTFKTTRVASIDILRGLTIFVMVFVNDVAGVSDIPAWMKHIPPGENGMTFVDVVFPAFLFIVGMAIPLSLNKRLEKGDSNWQIWQHILIRAAALIVLGVLMINGESINPEATGMSKELWNSLMFLSVILVWNKYPEAEGRRKNWFVALRWIGIITLVILIAIYRRGDAATGITWMRPEWWGILGLIGWAYLTATAVYWAFRKSIYAVAGVFVALVILNAVDKADVSIMNITEFIGLVLYPIQDGAHASITLAGVITTMLFLKNSPVQSVRDRLVAVLVFALAMTAGGYFLAPLGISKIGATPTWCFYSAAICCALFAFLYWLVDIKEVSRWADFLKPAAVNPLLTYILPFIYYHAIGTGYLGSYWRTGVQGILWSIMFSLIILGIAAILTRWRIRLQL